MRKALVSERQINLIWWGDEEVDMRDLLDRHRAKSSVRDRFVFSNTHSELLEALSAEQPYNTLFISKSAEEARQFITTHSSMFETSFLIVMPAPFLPELDHGLREKITIKPYFFCKSGTRTHRVACVSRKRTSKP